MNEMNETSKPQCPNCRGVELVYGWTNNPRRFYPDNAGFSFGYQYNAFVCLNCKYVGLFLDNSVDIDKLRSYLP